MSVLPFGDAHVYHGWYGGWIWEYTQMTEPFVSELGATSLPNCETLIKFMPNAWPIKDHAEEWSSVAGNSGSDARLGRSV